MTNPRSIIAPIVDTLYSLAAAHSPDSGDRVALEGHARLLKSLLDGGVWLSREQWGRLLSEMAYSAEDASIRSHTWAGHHHGKESASRLKALTDLAAAIRKQLEGSESVHVGQTAALDRGAGFGASGSRRHHRNRQTELGRTTMATKCGTRSTYTAGCRCEKCRAANAAYIREWTLVGSTRDMLCNLVAHLSDREILSEGQLAKILRLDRVSVRELIDSAKERIG